MAVNFVPYVALQYLNLYWSYVIDPKDILHACLSLNKMHRVFHHGER